MTMSMVADSTRVISPVKWQGGSDFLQKLRDAKKIQVDLPAGWSIGRIPEGRICYGNHNTRITSWEHPMLKHAHSATSKHFLTKVLDGHGNEREETALQQEIENRTPIVDHIAVCHPSRQLPIILKPYQSLSELVRFARLNTTNEPESLPLGWTIFKDPDLDYPVFVNPSSRIVQCQHPETHSILEVDKTLACNITGAGTSIVCKVCHFWYVCRINRTHGKLEITVQGKDKVLAESYEQIMRIPGYELRKKLVVSFRDKDISKLDGDMREWFGLMFRELSEPGYGLFQYAKDDGHGLELFSGLSLGSDHLNRFKFLGRFIAMSLYHRKPVVSGFGPTLMFYKRLLKRECNAVNTDYLKTMNSVSALDNESSRPIQSQKKKNFGASFFSVLKTVKDRFNYGSGCPNSAKTSNPEKDELKVGLNDDCSKILEERWRAVIDGLNEVIPEQWLRYFNPYDLQLLLCGVQNIDTDTWQRHTVYKDCVPTSKQVVWFWRFVKALDNEKRSRLLQLSLGICAFPVAGTFPVPKFCIEMATSGARSVFPCHSRRVLYLAPYVTYRLLVKDLTELIKGTETVAYN